MKFEKGIHYSSYIRTELVEMLSCIKGRFFEVGCGTGATLEYLKSRGASYVAGIDINTNSIEIDAGRGLDIALTGDVEKEELSFKEKEFDCIILADVLEHLYNPWDTLKKLSPFLADKGYVLLSLPNIKHYSILRRLMFHDEWAYADAGILDNSHIRFFTFKEIKGLLDYAGFKIIKVKCINSSGHKMRLINKLLFGKLDSFLAVQYYILAQKRLQ